MICTSSELQCVWYALKRVKVKPVSRRLAPGFRDRFWNEMIKSGITSQSCSETTRVPRVAGFSLSALSSAEWQETAGRNSWVPLMKRALRCSDLLIKWNKTNIPWWFPERSLPGISFEFPYPFWVPLGGRNHTWKLSFKWLVFVSEIFTFHVFWASFLDSTQRSGLFYLLRHLSSEPEPRDL